MRILVFANTPAHVHLYRHAVDRLENRGHDVLVLVRDAGCTRTLADHFDLPFKVYGSHDRGPDAPLSFARQLTGQFASIARSTIRFRPDVVFGRGPYAAFAGTLARARTVLVLDDEPGTLLHDVSSRFADCVLSPAATRRDLGPNHYVFDGFLECAYLHPDVFDPADATAVREDLGVEPDDAVVLVRTNAHDAVHDLGLRGFSSSEVRDLLAVLSERATVVVADESDTLDLADLPARPYGLHPARIHDALAAADLLVADTGTMVVEAALLGTPAIRYAPSSRRFGEFAALESAGLATVCSSFDAVVSEALAVLSDEDAAARYRRRRDALVPELTNLTRVLVALAEAHESASSRPSDDRRVRPRTPRASGGRPCRRTVGDRD